jgi:uncharacterized protein DUF5317
MLFTAVAVVVGLALGLVTGGRLQHLADRRFRGAPLLVAGLVVQAASGRVGGDDLAVPLVVVSYVLLLAFVAANLRLVGMGVVFVGLLLNFTTIVVNGGMPVRRSAIVAAGIKEWDELDGNLVLDQKRHLERPDDGLMSISDIVPVPGFRYVLSFGDIAMSVGVADVIVHLLRPLPARRHFADA